MVDTFSTQATPQPVAAPYCILGDETSPKRVPLSPPDDWVGPDFQGDFHTLVIPPNIIARINSSPSLPVMTAQWYWTVHIPGLIIERIDHSAQISYSEKGRNDKSKRISYTSNTLLASYDFVGDIIGGVLTANCVVHWRDPATGNRGVTPVGTQTFGILGDNPTKKDVRLALGSIEMQVIAYKESRLKQFDNQGLPLWGPPNGFGIMQLDNPKPTARQIWDWRENTAGAASLLSTKKSEVSRHFDNVYNKFPKASKLSSSELKLSVYQYYNGGWYWEWDDVNAVWIKSGVTSYGDDAVRIENLVVAGKPPADWA